MKKLRTLLALALTLCGTIAVFPVNAHAEEIDTQTVTANSVEKMANPARIRQDVIRLDEHDIRSGIRSDKPSWPTMANCPISFETFLTSIRLSALLSEK